MLEYLDSQDYLIVRKTLACAIGLGPAIVLHEIHRWLKHNELTERKDTNPRHYRDGKWWTWNTYEEWEESIEVFSLESIKRYLAELKELGIVESDTFNGMAFDRTKWYTINYQTYEEYMRMWFYFGQPAVNGGRKSDHRTCFEDAWKDRTNLPNGSSLPDDEVNLTHSQQVNLTRPIPENTETTTESLASPVGDARSLIIADDELVSDDTGEDLPKGKVLPETDLEKLIVHFSGQGNARYLTEAQQRRLNETDISLHGEQRITANELAAQDYRYMIWAEEHLGQQRKKAGGRLSATSVISAATNLTLFRKWCEEHKREYRAPGEKVDAVSRTGGKSWLEVMVEKKRKKEQENNG